MGDGGSQPIRVLVVDDHDLFRAGLVALLESAAGIEVAGHASRGTLGVRLTRELHPDVVLMDLRMPDLDGISATRQIIEADPDARVVALTIAEDPQEIGQALLAGACGYVIKDSPLSDTLTAVRAAAAGESWLSPHAATAVLEIMRREHVAPGADSRAAELLSPREIEILRLIARGLTNSEIADELSISRETAKNHVANLTAKLGLSNRVQAAVFAVRNGIT